jgi:hypothetical protein
MTDTKKQNSQCAKNKPAKKCLTHKCLTFNRYSSQGLSCAFYLPEDRGYTGHFWQRKGRIMRRQYFNSYIMLYFIAIVVVFSVLGVGSVINGTEDEFFTVENIFTWISVWLILLFPFSVFSLLNRYLFGRRVCLLNEEGIFCNERFISWEEIQYMTFNCGSISKVHFKYACVAVSDEERKKFLIIPHAPYYMLRVAKKYAPNMRTSFSF